jgi:hypothetical protein
VKGSRNILLKYPQKNKIIKKKKLFPVHRVEALGEV